MSVVFSIDHVHSTTWRNLNLVLWSFIYIDEILSLAYNGSYWNNPSVFLVVISKLMFIHFNRTCFVLLTLSFNHYGFFRTAKELNLSELHPNTHYLASFAHFEKFLVIKRPGPLKLDGYSFSPINRRHNDHQRRILLLVKTIYPDLRSGSHSVSSWWSQDVRTRQMDTLNYRHAPAKHDLAFYHSSGPVLFLGQPCVAQLQKSKAAYSQLNSTGNDSWSWEHIQKPWSSSFM